MAPRQPNQPSKHFFRSTKEMSSHASDCHTVAAEVVAAGIRRDDERFQSALAAAHPNRKTGVAKAPDDVRRSAFYVPIYAVGSGCGSPGSLCAEHGEGNG